MARPPDPLRGFRFLVEIEGIASGGFARVKGLTREVKIESRREGGVNDYEHKLMSGVSYASVVFERGLALDDLWQWALDAADGNVTRKNVWVRLRDEAGAVVSKWAWHIESAFPVKWSTSDLDGASSQVLVESLELAHHGLRKAT
jgi:phage tail-like protein